MQRTYFVIVVIIFCIGNLLMVLKFTSFFCTQFPTEHVSRVGQNGVFRIGVSPGPVQFCEPRAATGSSSTNPTLLGRI